MNTRSEATKPAIILVEPQLGENIGAVARAMHNFTLVDLRLVRPRDGWPSPAAQAMASGANEILDNVRIYASTEEAIADLTLVLASSARTRDMTKTELSPEAAAMRIDKLARGQAGILFGPERSGLSNEDSARAHALIRIRANPKFSSLNLAQAVLLIGYCWWKTREDLCDQTDIGPSPPAHRQDIARMIEHLQRELESANFFYPPEKASSMKLNLHNLFSRLPLTDQDVRTLRGIIRALTQKNRHS